MAKPKQRGNFINILTRMYRHPFFWSVVKSLLFFSVGIIAVQWIDPAEISLD